MNKPSKDIGNNDTTKSQEKSDEDKYYEPNPDNPGKPMPNPFPSPTPTPDKPTFPI